MSTIVIQILIGTAASVLNEVLAIVLHSRPELAAELQKIIADIATLPAVISSGK